MIICSNDALLVMNRLWNNHRSWGYRRLRAAVRRLGYAVTERQVRAYLRKVSGRLT